MKTSRRVLLGISPFIFWQGFPTRMIAASEESALPFGEKYPELDSLATGEWR